MATIPFSAVILIAVISTSYALAGLMFPHGEQEGDSIVEPNDDSSSGEVQISTLFPFFDNNHDFLYVNTNGVISFLVEVSAFTPNPFPLSDNMRVVAVFWGDVNTIHHGNVTYRELVRDPQNEQLFSQADAVVRGALVDQFRFTSTWMFIATWDKVPFFGASENDALNITNTFQAVLITNGRHSFAIFNYEEITWTTGTASGGNSSGLGGTPAQVGFNAGDGFTYYAVPESRTNAIVDIDEKSNIGTPGRFLFRIDSSDIVDSGCNTEGTLAVSPRTGSMLGGDIVYISGPCLDGSSAIVCRFAGVEVPGEVVSNTSARCISPLVFEVGRLPLKMSTNGGDSFNFTGIFTYLSPEDVSPSVKRLNAAEWPQKVPLFVSWDTELFQDAVEYVRISVYGYKEDVATREVKLQPVYSISQRVSYDEGVFSFRRPVAPDGDKYTVGAVRVSQYRATGGNELSLPGMWSDIHNLRWLYPVSDPLAWCNDWLKQEKLNLDFLKVTESCPCTLTQAIVDTGRFTQHPLCSLATPVSCERFKPGAVHCVRANSPSEEEGGQECCYGNDGKILNVLRSSGGGFAHRRHHRGVAPYKDAGRVPYLSHWYSDILPFENCCLSDKKSCGRYKRVRPSQTCEGYTAPSPVIVAGDPHLTTLDGIAYTFNGIGEYTLLEASSGSFVMQARMEVLQIGTPVATVVTALAAVHKGSSDQIHVEVSNRRGMDVWYRQERNGSNWALLDFEDSQRRQIDLEGVTIFYLHLNDSDVTSKNIHVNFKCGVSLVVSTMSGVLNVFTALQQQLKGRTRGLYGNWNEVKHDEFERPDGTNLPINATVQEIHTEFAQKWQIQPEESLFRYPSGKVPSDYIDEAFTPSFMSPEAAVTETVSQICGNVSQCAFDFAVTGNSDIAKATRDMFTHYGAAIESSSIVVCGSLAVPASGSKEVSRSSEGGVAIFTCDDGYTLQGESELQCQNNGQWSGAVPSCKSSGVQAWEIALIVVICCLVLIAVAIAIVVRRSRK